MPLVSLFPTKHEGYFVSRSGEVWSSKQPWKGLIKLRPYPSSHGYLRVKVHCAEIRKVAFVHYLMMDAFHGPKPTPAHQVRHLNGNQTDNRAENLAWGTASENALDRVRHGTNVLPPETSRAKSVATKKLKRAARAPSVKEQKRG